MIAMNRWLDVESQADEYLLSAKDALPDLFTQVDKLLYLPHAESKANWIGCMKCYECRPPARASTLHEAQD
jgi:hypothetical protein